MRRGQQLLLAELTKALYSASPTPSTHPVAASAPAPNALATNRLSGKITEWDPFERRGVVEDARGHRYHIANTRAFETVLPTMLRTLEGAVVEFDVDAEATADRVIIRSRLTPITAESYRQKPPVNFLSPEMLGHLRPKHRAVSDEKVDEESPSSRASKPAAAAAAAADGKAGSVVLYAKNIIVDISSIPAKQIARWSGPLSEEEVIKPTKNLKDMRSSRLFDRETNAYLKLKQQLGSGEEARRRLAEQRERAEGTAVRREVVAENVTGIVLAWSGIHRSGIIREIVDGEQEGGKEGGDASATSTVTLEEGDGAAAKARVCIIRNVHAFNSALPTSQSLLQRRVMFTKVTYSTQPNRFFAERIEVLGEVRYDQAVPSLEEAHAAKQKERAASLKPGRQGHLILEDSEEPAVAEQRRETDGSGSKGSTLKSGVDAEPTAEPVDPNKVFYGVIVRWSGGQGVIEGGDGRHYFLRSAADFLQLVDQTSHQLRGAVVQFKQDADNPRYAREVDVLSTATTTMSEVRPLLERTQFCVVKGRSSASSPSSTNAAAPSAEGGDNAATEGKTEGEAAEAEAERVWVYGTLLSWSAVEGHGIVISDASDDDNRYVLRDPEENVVGYAAKHALLKKGRKVKFTTFGSTGRLVCNVVLLDTEAEEEALRAEELQPQRPKEPEMTLDGNMNEAIPSPMSTSYWLNRMDKAGYDTREVKEMQNRALTLDEDDDGGDDGTEGGKFLDSEELLKKDHWWSDPRKNVRFPNSDMTAGHLALIGPASMMNVAMKTKDPKKLDKMLKKYQSRLTEDQKEYAWKQAKEMAPKYEECVRKGRERNEEPKFYFF